MSDIQHRLESGSATEPESEVDKAVTSLDRAKANGGIDPVTGRSIRETHIYLVDIANGLVDVDRSEIVKAAAVWRHLT